MTEEEYTHQLGYPKYFNYKNFMEIIDQMIISDEPLAALKMLDLLPAWYRWHMRDETQKLKDLINRKIFTLTQYVNQDSELYENSIQHEKTLHGDDFTIETMIDLPFCYPRGPEMVNLVQHYNKRKGLTPWICELAPSNYWLPYGLNAKDLCFTYTGQSIHRVAKDNHKVRIPEWVDKKPENVPTIFCCFETLEHLKDPNDIYYEYLALGVEFDHIMLSTPCGTLMGGHENWREEGIQHLRTFTPEEFSDIARRWFPKYDLELVLSDMMVLKLKKKI